MALYTSSYLKTITQQTSPEKIERLFSETKSQSSFDIFLSHIFLDRDEVQGLFIELTTMGFSVYVDWIIDPLLDRNTVTKATATIVRNRLKASKTLIVATSINASISGWIPWELGYIDGHTQNCAIVPVSMDSSPIRSFKGEGYLSLYPFISKELDANKVDHLWVIEESNKYVQLERWILGAKPFTRPTNIF